MKRTRNTIFRLLFLLLFLFSVNESYAQSDPTGEAPATRTYAITNAYIIQAPGKVIEAGTIVIENGLIQSVGTMVDIPSHAEVIDGTDLYIYPGFIDGMSYTGAERPESVERPDNLFTPDPPNDYAGITPEYSVVDHLSLEESSIADMREEGFTISHTVPYGRMLPGKGALMLLSEKEHVDELLLKTDASMYTQFAGAPGAYPGNTLGIMAKWRNLYRNAELSKQHAERYEEDPTNMVRPERDRVLMAFYPVVDKERPVFYNASDLLEAQRALRLQKELDFSLVIGNLTQGWDLIDQLKDEDVNVFMSLDLPDKPEDIENEDSTDVVALLEDRRMEFYNKHLEQFADMQNAGITFGFSTMGTTQSKIKDNLLAIVEHGLSEDDALASLTTEPAQLLGISDITGTLEAGKLGNAVVTTGPYFNEDSKIKMVFVDGDKFEYDTKENTSSVSEEAEAIILGTWEYSINSPQGEQTGQMIFTKDGDDLNGIFRNNDGTPDQDLYNISYLDGVLSFDFAFDAGGQSIEIVVVGDVSGNEFDGEASVAAFNLNFPITAVKEDPDQ